MLDFNIDATKIKPNNMAPQKTEIQTMRDTLKWAIAIMISLLVILIGGAVRAEVRINQSDEKVTKIQNDYLPYFAFEYIVESNNKLMNLITAIDSKDDLRYQQAMKEWSDLQQEVVKQAGKNKTRGGGSVPQSYK